MEKDKELQDNKPTNFRLKMTIGIVSLVVSSIVELYLMMNYSESYLFLGLVGLAILCFVYWITDLSFKMHREQESSFEKDMESLYKAQKVSYITIKQGFTKLEELLDELGEELSFPVDEVLQAQKAVGRVTIQKNKENIDAVVESNEKLIGHLQSFEQKFAEIGDRMNAIQPITSMPVSEGALDRQEEILNSLSRMEGMLQEAAGGTPSGQQQILDSLSEIEDLLRREFGREPVKDRQQEILDSLERIEASVRNEISELEVHMESKIDEIPSAVQEEQKMSPEELERILGETSTLMDNVQLDLPGENETEKAEVVSDEAAPADEFGAWEDLAAPEGIDAAADEFGVPQDLTIPELADMPEKPVEADLMRIPEESDEPEGTAISDGFEISGDLIMPEESGISEDLTLPEEVGISGDLIMPEEIGMSKDLDIPEAADLSKDAAMPEIIEIEAEPESASDTAASVTENETGTFAGSEKVMTPEEIAALLGSSSGPEEAVEEEKAPMPDLSDPGHVMTPEEIAALLENM